MCHASCLQFANVLTIADVAGKRVLEVGSYDVNGSVRDGIEMLGCAEYIGVDMRDGRGVDEVCNTSGLVERFGAESFDIVVSAEMMEHVEDWRAAISNMKQVCKTGGLILITTRSKGFPRHDYPGDFWRFEIEDMKAIFADCERLELMKDPQDPGVFLLARKPEGFGEVDLSAYKIHGVSTVEVCERKNSMETQKAIAVLTKYAAGELSSKKALAEAKKAVLSLPASHYRTVVLQDICRKIAGEETPRSLQREVNVAMANLSVPIIEPEVQDDPKGQVLEPAGVPADTTLNAAPAPPLTIPASSTPPLTPAEPLQQAPPLTPAPPVKPASPAKGKGGKE